MKNTGTTGTNGVDWEARVDFDRLRSDRLARLKAELDGELDVAGPDLARSMTDLGLIDEYRIYLHPVVLGSGKPFFAGPRPPLRLKASERMYEDVIRLTYIPA